MLFVIGLELQPSACGICGVPFLAGAWRRCWSAPAFYLSPPGALAFLARKPDRWHGPGASSTAICLQVMAERNLMRTPSGQAAFFDFAVSGRGCHPHPGADSYSGCLQSRPCHTWTAMSGWPFSRPSAQSPSSSVVASCCSLCCAGLQQTPEIFTATSAAAGGGHCHADDASWPVHGFGGFLAGVLLADSEYRSELETNIEPFAYCWACSSWLWA